ncbi:MAG: phenylacetate-CoA oxygenase subunit PaaC [Bacteroidia bacterium]|nr:phenylacetate-CoA oxygenase subunit PaaC [Bacteroidia bacterium]MDW8346397.1 1,2-phenylacetyl-CoA epoxidase subunit PaaC [Bacteroidia bacterium]
MNNEALVYFLLKIADDDLIIGHRNSEWTGLGPILEEDIAFSSMAQDELGHAYAYYKLLEGLGLGKPDKLAFMRNENEMKCCHLVEYPIGDYSFSLTRNFLYVYAKQVRIEHLINCSYMPLARLAKKIKTELQYHQIHGRTWIEKLGKSTEEAHLRMQSAINEALPLAYSLFEPHVLDAQIVSEKVCVSEEDLEKEWESRVFEILEKAGFSIPTIDKKQHYGGRNAYHTTHLQPLLDEMTAVYRLDPDAEW